MRGASYVTRTLLPALVAALLLLVAPAVAQADTGAGTASPHVASGTLLRNGTGLYPRVVRLQHSGTANGQLVASVVDFDANGGVGVIYRSTDDGATWTEIGGVHDPGAKSGLCCNTLFELPKAVGALAAGTLLWSASVGADAGSGRRMSLPVWKSTDHGVTWSYLSTCAAAPNNGGLWEPEFNVDNEGDLVCHYSDETNPGAHSQSLQERFSSDGVTWGNPFPTVTPATVALRPGMVNTRQVADGSWVMTYEICGRGGTYDCAAYLRRSADGADWGDPALEGARIATPAGEFFAHAPTLAVSGSTLFVTGQQFKNSNGSLSSGSGDTVLRYVPGGSWVRIAAPVSVPSPDGTYCPNYSSPLLVSTDGSRLLEIATDYDGTVCKPYYATGASG